MTYESILRYMSTRPWLLEPDFLFMMQGIVLERLEAGKPPLEEIERRIVAAGNEPARTQSAQTAALPQNQDIAVVQVYGPMAGRANLFDQMSGMASYEALAKQIQAAADDPTVKGIVLEVDSPGGEVNNLNLAEEAIAYAKTKKPVMAHATGVVASAAYWLAAQAERFTVNPVSHVGSIGVYSVHTSRAKARAASNLEDTVIASTPLKASGNPYEPLTPEAKAELQRSVDSLHGLFVQAVARGRKVPLATAETWATGQTWMGQEAVDMGLADGIGTLQGAIDMARTRAKPQASSGAKPGFAAQGRLPQGSQEGATMNQLLEALGVSTEEEALAAVGDLKAKAATVGTLEADLKATQGKVGSLEAEVLEMSAKVTALSLDKEDSEQAALEARVDGMLARAQSEGKVTPDEVAGLRELVLGVEGKPGTGNADWLQANLASRAPLVPAQPAQPPTGPASAEGTDNPAYARIKAKAAELEARGMGKLAAMSEALRLLPEDSAQYLQTAREASRR
jgi:signal peptide peptidase SppA